MDGWMEVKQLWGCIRPECGPAASGSPPSSGTPTAAAGPPEETSFASPPLRSSCIAHYTHTSVAVSPTARSAGAGEERDVPPDLLRDPGLWKTRARRRVWADQSVKAGTHPVSHLECRTGTLVTRTAMMVMPTSCLLQSVCRDSESASSSVLKRSMYTCRVNTTVP